MCSISEEDESRNVSHLEEIKQTDKNNYTSKENKFQSVKNEGANKTRVKLKFYFNLNFGMSTFL